MLSGLREEEAKAAVKAAVQGAEESWKARIDEITVKLKTVEQQCQVHTHTSVIHFNSIQCRNPVLLYTLCRFLLESYFIFSYFVISYVI